MDVGVGTLVTPNVRLVRPIGEGAMGEVWLADHLTLETQVAVKFINEDVASDAPSSLDRFRREASAAAKIKSPHVVQTFDQGVMEDGTPYIVMELLHGESLGDRLDRVARLTMRQTAMVVSQVSKALRAAHRAGIIHRDIKPENIYLIPFEDGKLIKVLDFGIAKQTRMPESRRLTQDGLLIGTPEYMCRDQIVKLGAVDFRSDLWALAVVAYECLTGSLPFDGPTLGMVCANIINSKYTPATALREDLPPDVDAWFERALHAKPEERFESAKEMAASFLRLLPTRIADIEADLFDSDGAGFSIAPGAHPQMASLGQPRVGTKVGAPAPALRPASSRQPAGTDSDHESTPRNTLPSVGARRRQTLAGSASELRPSGAFRPQRNRVLLGGLAAAALVGGLVTYLVVRPVARDARAAGDNRAAAAATPAPQAATSTASSLAAKPAVEATADEKAAKPSVSAPASSVAAPPEMTGRTGAAAPSATKSTATILTTSKPAATQTKPPIKPPPVKTAPPTSTSPEALGF